MAPEWTRLPFVKFVVRTSFAILLAARFVCGQELRQNGNPAATVMKSRQRSTAIIKEPMVLGIGGTWAVISWTTNAGGKRNARIYAGTHQKNLKQLAQTLADPANNRVESYQEQEYSHLVRLSNLKPGTTYYCQADSGSIGDHGPASKSKISKFTTSGVAPEKTAGRNASAKGPPLRQTTPRRTQAGLKTNQPVQLLTTETLRHGENLEHK